MRVQIKSKQDLNKVTHSVRAAQAVLQYGVGAMVDFQDQTLVTAAPEYWTKTKRIYDDRFAKALNVDYFATPENIPTMVFLSEMQKVSAFIEMAAGVQRKGQRQGSCKRSVYDKTYAMSQMPSGSGCFSYCYSM